MTYTIVQAQELLQEMRDQDQELLNQEFVDFEAFEVYSQKVCEVIKEIIAEHGEISISKFGEVTSNNAWLLVQHMDWNVEFQQEYLDLMMKNPDDYLDSNIAYLTDRVFVNNGKPQVYGTQFQSFPDEDKYRPRPTIDPKNVNQRRNEVGLETIEEYSKNWPTADLSNFYTL